MSSERDMRQRVIRALRPLHAVSVENGVGPGTPDVNFVGGWLELKSVDKWPAHEDTPLRVDHFTQQQKVWLIKRIKAGGVALLLLKVDNDWLLFDGHVAAHIIGRRPKESLMDLALTKWLDGLDEKDFRQFIVEFCQYA
jgi:hypothetical protein